MGPWEKLLLNLEESPKQSPEQEPKADPAEDSGEVKPQEPARASKGKSKS